MVFEKVVEGEDADQLKAKCPMDVFDIEEIVSDGTNKKIKKDGNTGNGSGKATVRRAVAARPRNCSMCRECVRGSPPSATLINGQPSSTWSEYISLRRVRDHFIFSIETTGAYSPTDVMREAVGVLKQKCETIQKELKGVQEKKEEENQEDEDEDEEGEQMEE